MPAIQEERARFVLWHRFNRQDTWRPIAAASTTFELVDVMSKGDGGEYQDCPIGTLPAGKCEQLTAKKLAEITIRNDESNAI